MKKIVSIVSFMLVVIFMSGCGAAKLTPSQEADVKSKSPMYTQVSMWTEKGHIIATNYKKGVFIPVNSKVIISEVSSNAIVMIFNDQEIVIKNIEGYTKVNISQLLARSFSKTKVDLSKFTKTEQDNIKKGMVKIGMSKEAVVVARGYPPAHRTISLKENSWRYWTNRFNTNVYEFKDNKVSKIIR